MRTLERRAEGVRLRHPQTNQHKRSKEEVNVPSTEDAEEERRGRLLSLTGVFNMVT